MAANPRYPLKLAPKEVYTVKAVLVSEISLVNRKSGQKKNKIVISKKNLIRIKNLHLFVVEAQLQSDYTVPH